MWLAELSVYEFEREMSDNIIIITNSDELISRAAAALPSTVCLLLAIGFTNSCYESFRSSRR